MRGRRQAARACPHHKRHKAPSGSSGRGMGALVSRSPVGRGPERVMWLPSPPANRLADRRVAGRHAARMVRGLHYGVWPVAQSASSTNTRCDGAFSSIIAPAECRVLVQQAHPISFSVGLVSRTLNAPTNPCQNSLRPMPGTRAHPRPRQWLWLAGDGCASCPLLQRLAQSFFPWAAPIPRGTKKRRSAPSSTTFRPCGCSECKPLPQTSHRGRE